MPWLVRYRQWLLWLRQAVGVYALCTGLGMVWGGDVRLMGPSYTQARLFAEQIGARPSLLWGITMAFFGVLVLIPRKPVCFVGLWGVAGWSVLFALSWVWSVNTVPLAGVTGIFTHAFMACLTTGLILVRVIDRDAP